MQKNKLMFFVLALCVSSCGVKTDPVPPVKPVDIGYGKPVYKGEKNQNKQKNKSTQEENEQE